MSTQEHSLSASDVPPPMALLQMVTGYRVSQAIHIEQVGLTLSRVIPTTSAACVIEGARVQQQKVSKNEHLAMFSQTRRSRYE
jgi:hypothetical protein